MTQSPKVVLALKRHCEEKGMTRPFPNTFPNDALLSVIFPAYASSSEQKKEDPSLGQSECKQLLKDLSVLAKFKITPAGFSVAWGKCKKAKLSATAFAKLLLAELASRAKPRTTKNNDILRYVCSTCYVEYWHVVGP